jgi:hypothetical protein
MAAPIQCADCAVEKKSLHADTLRALLNCLESAIAAGKSPHRRGVNDGILDFER